MQDTTFSAGEGEYEGRSIKGILLRLDSGGVLGVKVRGEDLRIEYVGQDLELQVRTIPDVVKGPLADERLLVTNCAYALRGRLTNGASLTEAVRAEHSLMRKALSGAEKPLFDAPSIAEVEAITGKARAGTCKMSVDPSVSHITGNAIDWSRGFDEGYDKGREEGYKRGKLDGAHDAEQDWHELCRPSPLAAEEELECFAEPKAWYDLGSGKKTIAHARRCAQGVLKTDYFSGENVLKWTFRHAAHTAYGQENFENTDAARDRIRELEEMFGGLV